MNMASERMENFDFQLTADSSFSVLKQLACTLSSEGSEPNVSDTSADSSETLVSSSTDKISTGAFVPYTSPERLGTQPSLTSTPIQNRYNQCTTVPSVLSTSPIYAQRAAPGKATREETSYQRPAPGKVTTEETAVPVKMTRPNISYTALIAMAILNSREKKLQLHQIYDFIQYKFPYYRMTSSKWKNCVRHNLSLSDRFVKLGRKDTRGNFWAINEKYYDELVRNISQNADLAFMNYPALASAMGVSFPAMPHVVPNGYLPPVSITPALPSSPLPQHIPSPYTMPVPLSISQPYAPMQANFLHGVPHLPTQTSYTPHGAPTFKIGHSYRYRPY